MVRNTVMDCDSARVPSPDSDGPIALPGHIPSIVRGLAVRNFATVYSSDDDPVPTVVCEIFRITRIIQGSTIGDDDVSSTLFDG